MKEGFRSGKIVTMKKVQNRKKAEKLPAKWLCKCDCGGEKVVAEASLYNGATTTCGCLFNLNDEDYKEKIKGIIKKGIEVNENGCWIWKKAQKKHGYGQIGFRGKSQLVHRASWFVFNGEIPKGIKVCHKCDVRLCVNPDHLFLGTQNDNVQDAKDKGRFKGFKEQKVQKIQNKLNWEQVQEIKRLSREGMTRKDLETRFGVSQTCIAKILTEVSWNKNWTQEL